MVVSSVQAAKKLVKKCEFRRDATRANIGVLVGKGNSCVLNIEACLFSNFEIREQPHMATKFNYAYLPLHNVSCGGTVF